MSKKRRYLKHRRIKALYYELKCLDNEFGKVIEFENTFDEEIKKFLTNKLNFDVVKVIERYFYKIMDDINFDNNSIKEDMTISVKIIGIRFELNDSHITAIGKLIDK